MLVMSQTQKFKLPTSILNKHLLDPPQKCLGQRNRENFMGNTQQQSSTPGGVTGWLPASQKQRIFCVSDVHVDIKQNRDYWESFDYSPYNRSDVLLVAGDVATKITIIQDFLVLMKKHFG